MKPLTVPTNTDKYSDFEFVTVETSQKSAKDGQGWSLRKIEERLNPLASKCVSDYLNRPQKGTDKLIISGKSNTSCFLLVWLMSLLTMETYPPIFPILKIPLTDLMLNMPFE